MTRANYLPAPAAFNLSMACVIVNQAFGEHGCYLVGSSLERRDYRDVDVRHLSQHSGLPVDFQIQRTTEANATYPGQRRHPLGIFFEAPR